MVGRGSGAPGEEPTTVSEHTHNNRKGKGNNKDGEDVAENHSGGDK